MADVDSNTPVTIEQLQAQMREMRAIIEQQQAQITALRQTNEGHDEQPDALECDADKASDPAQPPRLKTRRRTILKWMGVAAAGTAASAAGVLATSQTARAADGDYLTVGYLTQGTATTTLQNVSGSGPQPLMLVDNSQGTGASGVWGHGGTNSSGVYGQTSGIKSRGVYGVSDTGYGVVGVSSSGIDLYAFGTGRFQQFLQGTAGAPTTGTYNAGEQVRDSQGELWLCTANGTPGTWVRASHTQPNYIGGSLNFFAAPIRVIDTRAGQPAPLPTTKAPLKSGSTTTFQITGTAVGGVSVPSGAVGVYANVTVVFPTNGGNLIFYPTGASVPSASTINYNPGTQVVGNFTIVGLSTAGQFSVVVNGPGNTDVVVDIAGFIM